MTIESLVKKPTQIEMFESMEIARPDVNIGKWAGWIFASPWSKNLHDPKKHVWQTEFDDRLVKASIAIRPVSGMKRPTTTSYRVFLALLQIWEQLEKPVDGVIVFSARQLAEMLHMKGFGRRNAEIIHEHLEILSGTLLTWTFAFEKEGQRERVVSDMHIIDGQTYFEREVFAKKELFTRQQIVRLNPDLVANMLAGKTKPINYKVFISIRNDSSANLYTLLDVYLAKKRRWERRAKALIYEDLEFSGKRYEQKRLRLAKLKEFVHELNGKDMMYGRLKLSYCETSDAQDYKLVAEKVPRKGKKKRTPPKIANSPGEIAYIVGEILKTLSRLPGGVSSSPKTQKTLELLGRWYSKNLLFRALAIVKSEVQVKKTPVKAFVYQVHVLAHEQGFSWVRDCGDQCRYRPENRTPLFEQKG